MSWMMPAAVIGSSLFSNKAAKGAASDAAAASLAAGERAAAAAEFKPYGISSGFGTSYFDTENQKAGYQLDPVLEAFRNSMYAGAGEFMGQVQADPQEAAQNYYNQQQGLMAGGREAEDIALRNQQLQSGRIGLGLSGAAMGAGAGTGYVNPQQYQQQLARSQQDQQLAAQSQQLAQSDIDRSISRATGLFQTGAGIEEMGLRNLTIGADIGSKQQTSGNAQAQALLAGGQGAADARLAGGIQQANMFGDLGYGLAGLTRKKG
tara:strand:- start:782 stop:1570 length:789 start_codon:yes stop_codon:yes gene_type:complete